MEDAATDPLLRKHGEEGSTRFSHNARAATRIIVSIECDYTIQISGFTHAD